MEENNELIRLARTGIQALVAGAVALLGAWMLDTVGVEIDQEQVTAWLLPVVFLFVMPAVTWAVTQLAKIPVVGPWLEYLNGPKRQVEYTLAA